MTTAPPLSALSSTFIMTTAPPFISFCYDVIPVFEFVQRINFTFRKVAACMRFVFVGGGGGVYVPLDRFDESFHGMVYIFW